MYHRAAVRPLYCLAHAIAPNCRIFAHTVQRRRAPKTIREISLERAKIILRDDRDALHGQVVPQGLRCENREP